MIAEFAQIVGLLSAFASQRQANYQADLSEFLVWLTEHNHEEIRDAIEANQTTTIGIKSLLYKGLDDVHAKLDSISDRIAILSSRSDGVKDLAASYARATFSDQSLEILSQMEENEAEYFLLFRELGAKDQRLILSAGPNYICKETRFFRDDLALMVELGLLREDSNSKGEPIYFYIRAASQLVQSLQ